jgi:hypothetical protein
MSFSDTPDFFEKSRRDAPVGIIGFNVKETMGA